MHVLNSTVEIKPQNEQIVSVTYREGSKIILPSGAKHVYCNKTKTDKSRVFLNLAFLSFRQTTVG